jgi:flagellar biogenesis protein FliO
MKKQLILAASLFFLVTSYLCAAEVKAPQPAPTAVSQDSGYLSKEYNTVEYPKAVAPPDIMSTLINLLGGLLFIIILIYVILRAGKFLYVKASIPIKNENVVTVLAKEYLDNKMALYVVEFADKVLLLGSSGQAISTLTEINDKETVDKVKQKADEFIAKYTLRSESKFEDELKSSYLKQGKKLVDSGNTVIRNIMDKFNKKDKK